VIEQHRVEVRGILQRAVAFRQQVQATHGTANLPTFRLPDAPAPRADICVSCGAPRTHPLRCRRCTVAVLIALDAQAALAALTR
jgi:hypothetical protein